jgi:hypothetical protein
VTDNDYGKACALNGVFVLKSMEASIEEGFVLPQVCNLCRVRFEVY